MISYFVYSTDNFDAHSLIEFSKIEDAIDFIKRKESKGYSCSLIEGKEIFL